MGDLLPDSFVKPVKVPDIVETVRHTERQQARIVRKSSERGIQIFRIRINVQSSQFVHLPHDAPLLLVEGPLIQEFIAIGMHKKIMQKSNRKERRILQGFPESESDFPSMSSVILTCAAFDCGKMRTCEAVGCAKYFSRLVIRPC